MYALSPERSFISGFSTAYKR